jgi:hypothetical protein
MLDRTFVRRVRLLRGREEVITFRYTINKDDQLIEHVTMSVPADYPKRAVTVTVPSSPDKG